MPIEAVIFDMDGVLVDSEVYWAQGRIEYARDLGKHWGQDDYQLVMGRATLEWAEVMRERMELDFDPRQIADEMIERMRAKYTERLPVRPGAVEAVKLAASRYRVGLASGSPTPLIQHVTQLTGLDKIFEVMVFGDDIPNGKPSPDIYLAALQHLGVEPSRAVGIEDSGNGLRSLKAAGMYAIAAPSPDFPLSDEVLSLADAHIESMEDFTLELVESLSPQPPR